MYKDSQGVFEPGYFWTISSQNGLSVGILNYRVEIYGTGILRNCRIIKQRKCKSMINARDLKNFIFREWANDRRIDGNFEDVIIYIYITERV